MIRPASAAVAALLLVAVSRADERSAPRLYENRLTPLRNPAPLLADHPEFVEPVREAARFEAPVLVDEPGADLTVRSWRFSYNARGIIEMPNRLLARSTAIVVVHPWGIDDGQGWRTPEPAGAAFACTPIKNRICRDHASKVIDPFLKSLRGKVGLIAYSLPGSEDPIRRKLYRSIRARPNDTGRREGAAELAARLNGFHYGGGPVPKTFTLSSDRPVADYFRQFPGLDAGMGVDGPGFWDLPIPVMKQIAVAPDDVVYYDSEGYPALRQFLQAQGIQNVLLCGYHTDMCVRSTTCGYLNLSPDFNTFLVGDATLPTFPANETPRFAANAAVSFASLSQMITQVSWVRYRPRMAARPAG